MDKNIRINISESMAKGLGIGEEVSISLKGKIKSLETYDFSKYNQTAMPENDASKKKEKEEPYVCVKIDFTDLSIDGKANGKKVFDEEYDKLSKKEEEE